MLLVLTVIVHLLKEVTFKETEMYYILLPLYDYEDSKAEVMSFKTKKEAWAFIEKERLTWALVNKSDDKKDDE